MSKYEALLTDFAAEVLKGDAIVWTIDIASVIERLDAAEKEVKQKERS